jgi:hypothetical protein
VLLPTVGFMNPIGFLPTASRASFTDESIAATTGDEAEVPEAGNNIPSAAAITLALVAHMRDLVTQSTK